MRIFITGAAGFIGSKLANSLVLRGNEILGYDNFHPQVHGLNSPGKSDFRIVKGDVLDRVFLSQTLKEFSPEIIFHLAAETGTGQSFDEPSRYINVNCIGVSNLYEAIRYAGIGQSVRKVILASSRSVYGEGCYYNNHGEIEYPVARTSADMSSLDFNVYNKDRQILKPCPTNESFTPLPDSIYASTKLMQEFCVKQLSGSINWTILRLQNVYGPGQSLLNPYTGVLSIFCSQIIRGEVLDIYEDGEIFRDFVRVDDVVDALVCSMSESADNATINIGSGQAVSIREVAEELILLFKARGFISSLNISGKFRPGDIRHASADIDLAKQLLLWEPKCDLRSGLEALVDWTILKQEAPSNA